jgi:hypothetical protein
LLNHPLVSAWVSPSFWQNLMIYCCSKRSSWTKQECDEHGLDHFAIWQWQTHRAVLWGSKKSRLHMKVPSTTTLSFPTLWPLFTTGKNIVRYFLGTPRMHNIFHHLQTLTGGKVCHYVVIFFFIQKLL